jgi:Fic family protein
MSDMLLARSEDSAQRFYSLSNQILTEKKVCYHRIRKVQRSLEDITEWLEWFLHCLDRALTNTEEIVKKF